MLPAAGPVASGQGVTANDAVVATDNSNEVELGRWVGLREPI